MTGFWSTVLSILVAVLFFEVIVFVHEFGHFIAAKLCGVRVNEFAIGMGPAILKKQGKETKYSLRLFPIGGYCAMEGEMDDPTEDEKKDGEAAEEASQQTPELTEDESPEGSKRVQTALLSAYGASDGEKPVDDGRSFVSKPPWKRFIIITAGAFMNIVLGLIILFALLSSKDYLIGSTTISQLDEQNVSGQYGLSVGDTIKKINGISIYIDRDISMAMALDDDGVMDFVVERDGKEVTLKDVHFATREEKGETVTVYDFYISPIEKSVWSILKQAVCETFSIIRLVFLSLASLFTGRYGLNDLSGPIGTVAIISSTVLVNFQTMLMLMAYVTINVGVFNLLPIPALDGSKNLFIIIEMIFKKKIPAKWETIITTVGFVLLLLLIIFVSVNDIINIDKYKLAMLLPRM